MENQPMTEATPQEYAKIVVRHALFNTLLAVLALTGFGRSEWAMGVGLGALASVVNFAAMTLLLRRALFRGGGWGALSLGSRLILMGLALGVALTWPQWFTPAACAAGLFAVQITIFIDRFIVGLRARAVGSN